ncbi:Uncharacterized protein dnm_056050 [Desulfonema magnum]|uniref:Uncharacterized protein n=1 Tax=Desulfonema magnum TaxID=45655 RepID=A0A975GQ65_9BACT|nr:Uncharacterized protein dnm_056050 [Desulfonema magnum]
MGASHLLHTRKKLATKPQRDFVKLRVFVPLWQKKFRRANTSEVLKTSEV